MGGDQLVGSWRLVSWENRDADGTITYPMGRDVQGYIIYNPDGYMSVIITRSDRPAFRDADIGGGTDEELAQAAATCISYCGRYEVQPGRVVHYVESSLFPNWVGTTQERFLELDGSALTLSTAPVLYAGQQRRAYLVWQRVQGTFPR
jgi:Lipocalin-like domain